MPIEKPLDGSNLPKLLKAEAKETHKVSFDPRMDIETAKNDRGWSCYMIQDMMVEDEEEQEIEGTNEIPFWTMSEFFDCYDSMSSKQLKQKEITFLYIRKEKGAKNTATWEIDE